MSVKKTVAFPGPPCACILHVSRSLAPAVLDQRSQSLLRLSEARSSMLSHLLCQGRDDAFMECLRRLAREARSGQHGVAIRMGIMATKTAVT